MWETAKFVVFKRVLIIEKFRASALHSDPILTSCVNDEEMYKIYKNTFRIVKIKVSQSHYRS
jgi:hypothetical protein